MPSEASNPQAGIEASCEAHLWTSCVALVISAHSASSQAGTKLKIGFWKIRDLSTASRDSSELEQIAACQDTNPMDNLRIVSFLPAATEMAYALGLGDQLVGVSHECDFPADAKTKPVVVR